VIEISSFINLEIKRESELYYQLIIKILYSNSLVLNGYLIYEGENMGKKSLTGLLQFITQFLNCFNTVYCFLVGDMSFGCLQYEFIGQRIQNIFKLRKSKLHQVIVKNNSFFQIQRNLGQRNRCIGLNLQKHIDKGNLNRHNFNVFL
jgi:hypothetical protein